VNRLARDRQPAGRHPANRSIVRVGCVSSTPPPSEDQRERWEIDVRALRYDSFGPVTSVVRLVEAAQPRPGRGQVLVRVQYAAINPLDCKLVEGEFRRLFKSKPPAGIGTEFSGTVEALGPGVAMPKIGTPVVGFINPTARPPGALQQFVAVDAKDVLAVDAVDLDTACTLPVAGVAALQMCRLGEVKGGQRVLVHGAAGGVGSFAVQIVRLLGGKPVATGSRLSQPVLATLEPEAVVNYATQRVSAWGGPFNVVLDCASTLGDADIGELMPNGGRYVRTLPAFPSVLLDPVLNATRPVKRFTLKLKPNTEDVRTLLNWMRRGMLKPLISERVALANAIAALDHLQAGRAQGKLVVGVS
jgi:NADPH:quinone reductase-like Zn-dependent oxidoreductase